MNNSIHVDIISAEAEVFSGQASMVFASAVMGEVGIAPGHAPLVTNLSPGEIRVQTSDKTEQTFYVSGGILEVQPHMVTILSDVAMRAKDLDEHAVLEAKRQAEQALKDTEGSIEFATALARNAELAAQLQVIRRLSKHSKS